ncbi:hypothetical protein AX14_012713 [Amanita brunnescens Koide BX004]|nr:hypothetical protein AX14_012713 [Amanita brunnescens Koide BX004]
MVKAVGDRQDAIMAISRIQTGRLEADPDRRLISFRQMRSAKWWMGSDRPESSSLLVDAYTYGIFENEKTYKYFMSLEQQD